MAAKIIGTGSSFPLHLMTNEDMTKLVETSDEWIYSRTGIKERKIAKEETVTQLATEAAKKALGMSGSSAEEIDCILVASMSSDQLMPNVASSVQAKLGATNAFCMDVNAACSGFLYAMSVAHAYIEANMIKTAIVIGAETLSQLLDWEDRSTCVLFGDGAGAVVMKESKEGQCVIAHGADGTRGDVLTCYTNHENKFLNSIRMDGQEVFKFAVKTVPENILEVTKKAGYDIADIDWFLLHQANIRIIQSVAKRLKVDIEKFPSNLEQYGNTSAASIPILLDEINRDGKLKSGQKIVLSGFGGGLTYGSALIVW